MAHRIGAQPKYITFLRTIIECICLQKINAKSLRVRDAPRRLFADCEMKLISQGERLGKQTFQFRHAGTALLAAL